MLTEQDVFPNVPKGTPGLWKALTIQERARLRMTGRPLSVREVFDARDDTKPADFCDEVQKLTLATLP